MTQRRVVHAPMDEKHQVLRSRGGDPMSEQHGPAGQASALAARDEPGTPQAQSEAGAPPGSAAGQAQPDTPAASQPGPAAAPPPRRHVLRRTRTGGVWVAMGASAVVLLLLLIFILENQRQVNIGFFGAHASLPVGVAMLLAAVGGALIVIIPGTGRIIQLRLTARRHRRKDTAAATAAAQPPPAAQQPPAAPAPQEPPAAAVPQQPPADPEPQP
jgi:uncharacterized integral membrane protein